MSCHNLFLEIENHLLNDEKPSLYLIKLSNTNEFSNYPFNMIIKLKSIKQSPKFHPEGNVFNHTMLVVDEASKRKNKSKNKRVFMWSALLHDIGKADTTRVRKGKITSYDHDKVGAKLAKDFLMEFTQDDDFINKVCSLIKFHMQILFIVKELPFSNIKEMKEQTDVQEVALLGLCDRMGRTNSDINIEQKNIETFLQKVN